MTTVTWLGSAVEQKQKLQCLLQELPLPEGRRRPADVFECNGAELEPRLPNGARPHQSLPAALDVAVINPWGPSRWNDTLAKLAGAAEAYAARKRPHLDTVSKCTAAGARYQPLVFEAHGGANSETAAVLHKIAELGAARAGQDAAAILSDLLSKISVALARAAFKGVHRRWHGLVRSEAMPLAVFLRGARLAEPADL